MPVMLVVFDPDGLPVDVRGAELLDPELVAAIGATLWRVSGEIGESLGSRVDRVSLRAGPLHLELKFGVDAGYAVVIDEVAAGLVGLPEDDAAEPLSA
ncbi:hypothetical protein Pyrfu_1208 [Pyrolobus fumarii 1A]|uniref:Uncharacterized protein n=1 Tax=Pyrolobus fumarii (strain DSM 11204 / 1A) TaxID=694429 RepID=G0EFW9_PYRF1|nr:hypothetical protein [Pyrolobus fumarii]AEM39070.1 hypothetical protein Pyrfu_1208 [Pyrolobus fumarii 1A]